MFRIQATDIRSGTTYLYNGLWFDKEPKYPERYPTEAAAWEKIHQLRYREQRLEKLRFDVV